MNSSRYGCIFIFHILKKVVSVFTTACLASMARFVLSLTIAKFSPVFASLRASSASTPLENRLSNADKLASATVAVLSEATAYRLVFNRSIPVAGLNALIPKPAVFATSFIPMLPAKDPVVTKNACPDSINVLERYGSDTVPVP